MVVQLANMKRKEKEERKTGRLKKEVSEEVEEKLFELLQENYDALFKGEGSPRNVHNLLEEINRDSKRIAVRALHKKLRKYRKQGIFKKIDRSRESFYYYNKYSPAFLWSKTLKSFIDKMEIEKGISDWGLTLIPTETHFLTLEHKAAILEEGIDITSKLPLGEEVPRDILGEILSYIEEIVVREIRLRLDLRQDYNDLSFKRLVKKLQSYFIGKKLAIVYILDGSKFNVLDKEEMGKFPNF